jgi:hypothetical protein
LRASRAARSWQDFRARFPAIRNGRAVRVLFDIVKRRSIRKSLVALSRAAIHLEALLASKNCFQCLAANAWLRALRVDLETSWSF